MHKQLMAVIGGLALLLGMASVAYANHAWGNFHWLSSAKPFAVVLGDNVSTNWDAYLSVASNDWNVSSVLDTVILPGLSTLKTCKPTMGRVEVCNSKYGQNGWLGIASVWTSGNHITQGTVKMNDTYFNTVSYNKPAWRSLVLCQEIGHTLGLDHQDEAFANANLGTCMDYTNDPSTNQHPNQHDYDMLETIYAHLDGVSTTSVAVTTNGNDIDTNNAKEWGSEIRHSEDKRASLYVRELGNGKKVFTHVFWAEARN